MPRVSGHSFTLEDALRVVEVAGLDPTRPLTDQQANGHGDMDERIRVLADKVDQLVEALSPATDKPPVNSQEAAARALATKLHESQSKWVSLGGDGNE